MSFRVWNLWRSEPAQPGALSREVDRLAADPRVHRIFDWFTRHEREVAEFQLAITAVPAPSNAEHARAAWLRLCLNDLDLATSIDAAGNLLAARPALQPDAASIAVSAHLDTVFPAATQLNVRREHSRLLGPGISDNGSGLTALWALASAFHAAGIITATPLLFVANVGEEGEGNLRGIRHLYRGHISTPAPIFDPAPSPAIALLLALDGAGTENIITQALGSRRFEVVITGPGGHSWSDHGTPNPIVAAALVVNALFRIPLPVNPRTTLNVGTIQGGTSVNTIPERVVFKVDLRSSDPRRLDELEQQLRRAVADSCAEAASNSSQPSARLAHSILLVGERPAGELPAASHLLAAIRAVDTQLGIHSELLRASTDANIPLSLGLEAVTLGAGGTGGGAHTVHEWYDPAGREHALKRLTLLILLLAGLPPASASAQDFQSEDLQAKDSQSPEPESPEPR
jgi:acetylornithine deacetylase/succinyl-diaminopimelate desuccinylase-like protein